METFSVKMTLSKQTKGTVVYKAAKEESVSQLYISKNAFDGSIPQTVLITVAQEGTQD